ncbi:glycosyl transferase family protein [Chondrocystis sp. NIES-4102]|nr:glycosyl transferase family protein [Chondrocystis sp. NIES-4102]
MSLKIDDIHIHSLAVTKHKENKLEEALFLYSKSIELNEQQPAWIYANAITIAAQIGDYEAGVRFQTKAEELHSNSDEIYRAIGILFYNQHQLKDAVSYFQQALKLNNQQPEWIYIRVAENKLEENLLEEAIDIINQGKKQYPQSDWLEYLFLESLIKQQEWDKALTVAKQINVSDSKLLTKVEAKIEYIENHFNHSASIEDLTTSAVTKHKEGKLDEAIAHYLEIIKLDNNQPAWIYGNAITLLSKLKKYHQALQLANQALKSHYNSDEIHKALGLLNRQNGNLEESIKYYQEAIRINSDQPYWVYTHLIESLIEQNKIDEALELEKFIDKDHSQSHWLKYSLGNAYAQKKMWEEAKQLFIQALTIKPDFAEATDKLNIIANEKVVKKVKHNIESLVTQSNSNVNQLKLLSPHDDRLSKHDFAIKIKEIGLGGLTKFIFFYKEEINQPLEIKVIVDEQPIAKIKLTEIQPKKSQELEFFIPLLLLDNQQHKFEFICFPVNQSIVLKLVVPRRGIGRIEHCHENYLVGWIVPDGHFGEPAKVDIYIDDVFFTEAKADLCRQDLLKHGLGSGNNGFKIFLPLPAQSKEIYKIDVCFSGTKTQLKHSPLTVTASPVSTTQSLFQAKITDFQIGGVARGWAINHSDPNQNPKLKIIIDDEPIGVVQATTSYSSNLSESLGQIPKEFQIQLPFTFLDNQEHQFELIFVDREENLTQSIKMSLIIPRLSVGRIDSWHNNYITGWAVPERHNGKPTFLDVYVDGTFYQEIRADKPRKDLLKYKLGNGKNGFEVDLSLPPGKKIEYCVDIFYGGTKQRLQRSPIQITYSSLAEKFLLPPKAYGRFANLHKFKKSVQNRAITIVIPVFNAYEELRRCLKSVFKHTSIKANLLIINDCSTDTRIPSLLNWAATYSNVTVLTNQPNLGYTKTINKGINFAQTDDIVLLNSDTEVGPYWLQNLGNAVYHQADIATATAISNNSGAFSVPNVGLDNDFPIWLNNEEMIRAVSQNSKIIYPETPTGSGFCIYIRREVFNEIGTFDEVAFPRGYGEENDFCMRAVRAGWRNIVDDRTLVYHVRSASFRDEKTTLYDTGRNVVDERYPDYRGRVRVFIHSPQMNVMRYGIRKLIEGESPASINKPRPRVLFVISTQTGGTPQTNRDLMNGLQNHYTTMMLRCDATQIVLYDTSDGKEVICEDFKLQTPITLTSHQSSEYENIVGDLLINHAIEIVHIRHIAWHSLSLCNVAKKLGLKVIFSFHDFYTICPTVNLLDENQVFCGGNCTETEGDCSVLLWKNHNYVPKLKHSFIKAWREMIASIFPHVDAFVTTSVSSKNLIEAIYPQLKQQNFQVIPHGRDFSQLTKKCSKFSVNQPFDSKPLSILFPGNISSAKGADLIFALKALDIEDRLDFHFLGTITEDLKSIGIDHGCYKREDFNQLVNDIHPSYIGIFSIWPETYCHTLTESWASGVPVIAIDIGAVGERIKQHGGGWLIPPNLAPQEVYAKLLQIASDGDGYMTKVSEVNRWQLSYGRQNNIATMAQKYHRLYQSVISSSLTFRSGDLAKKSQSIIRLGVFIHRSDNNQSPPSAHIRVLEWLESYTVSQNIDFQIIDIDSFIYDRFNLFEIDMVLVQRNTIKPHLVDKFIKQCKQNNLPIVFEIDDDLTNVPKEKDPMGIYAKTAIGIKAIVEASSTVIVSTEPLSQKLSRYNSNIVVIPNTICEYTWLKPISPELFSHVDKTDKFEILYMGNPTHSEDLAIIKPVFERLANDGYNIQLYVIGGEQKDTNSNQMWYERIEIPSASRHYPQFVPWFRNISQSFNLAIAPLVDNEFNRCKSPLKFLQYSVVGLPAIYSNCTPYREVVTHGVNGFLSNNDQQSWVNAILECFSDHDKLSSIAQQAKQLILDKYLMSQFANTYIKVFSSVYSGKIEN